MPRFRRLIPEEFPLHIMVRGNNKQNIFHEDSDKYYYLHLLLSYKAEHEVEIYHYCLMDNHVHIILQSRRPDTVSLFMMKVDLSYFFLFKNKYGYVGHLFQNRFKSNIIDSNQYLIQCGKYIELNPVRKGIASKPEDCTFSSYRFYAFGSRSALISPDPLYLALSDCEEKRRKLYREFVVDESVVSREKLWKNLFIGNEDFIGRMEQLYGLPNIRRTRGRPPKTK